MTEPADNPAQPNGAAGAEAPELAEVRPLPVVAPQPTGGALVVQRLRELPAPILAATGGFLAGVATFVLVRVLRRPRPASSRALRRARKGSGRAPEVAATRSFLVDIHLLKR
ncbi:MAG: hypothetical protein WD649_04720 [Thermoleophilaceae bacterium]